MGCACVALSIMQVQLLNQKNKKQIKKINRLLHCMGIKLSSFIVSVCVALRTNSRAKEQQRTYDKCFLRATPGIGSPQGVSQLSVEVI